MLVIFTFTDESFGAEGKMEMEKVPALGYRIVGLPIAGLQRRMDWDLFWSTIHSINVREVYDGRFICPPARAP